MEEKLNLILAKLESLENGQAAIQQDVSTIKESVQRIEEGQPQDVWAMLDRIDKKLDKRLQESDSGIAALNKRVFSLESEIERLSRQ